MNLNQFGAACRCLLRLREDTGQPGLSDALFISQYLTRYPAWRDRPGETDLFVFCDLARELKLAERVESFRDYDRILQEHRAGRGIIVVTERTPNQSPDTSPDQRHALLLVKMNEAHFSVWCPFVSGLSDVLPAAERAWWDNWFSIGLVLYPPE